MSQFDTLLLQAVFCPIPALLDLQLKSLRTLAEYDRRFRLQVDFCFAGYVDPQLKGILAAEIAAWFPDRRVTFLPFQTNVGKARVVNETLRWLQQRGQQYLYLMTFDSDIQFLLEEKDILGRLKSVANGIEEVWGRPFGLAACNHAGDNAHLSARFDRRAGVSGETVAWPSLAGFPGGGIAGGCLFISMNAWIASGGYRSMGVYGPDDGYLLIDIDAAGYAYCVVESISVLHPPQYELKAYNEWKRMAMQQALKGAAFQIEGTQEALTASAEEFWRLQRPHSKTL